MEFANSNKPSIGYSANIRIYAGLRLFEQSEIMRPASTAHNSYDSFTSSDDRKLRFQGMAFLFAGIILFLLVFSVLYWLPVTFPVFFGRSISRSVVSIITVSILSSVSNAFFPGNLNFPDFISVFSIHTMIFQQFDSLTP